MSEWRGQSNVHKAGLTVKHFRQHGNWKSGQDHQRSSSAYFQKECFWYPMHSILDIIGGQNQAKVTKSNQIQMFKKCVFELLCIEKAF